MTRPIHRRIAVFLTAALIFANGAAFSYAADSGNSGADAAAMLLSSMGVISADSSGSFNLSKTVTRAEFAKMIVAASDYKDLVRTASSSSPYKDVAAKHWAAPYIRIAVSKGLMSGYSDGTFRPEGAMTLEQGVNSALKLLGYTQSDFTGAFPYAQMNIYSSSGLSQNIAGGIGSYMSKGDAANLIYNLMGETLKDGSKTYAESLGYSLNASGEVDYAGIVSGSMNGPYTVKSSNWINELGMNASSLTVYKNGSIAAASEVENYDVLYYSQSKGTVWVYDNKVTGIYEKASPSQNAVTSVTVSGTEYSLESAAAFSALSSTGGLKIGSAITLLLGKNGGVADAVSSTQLNEPVVVYVTEIGSKSYENASGNQYTSKYIRGVRPDGSEIEYAVSQDGIDAGDLLKISFDSEGRMSIGSASPGSGIYGKVDAALSVIGTTSIAANATILDTSQGNYTTTSLQRLNEVYIDSGKTLYYEASGGKITALILDDVTGDAAKYGIVTSARSGDSSGSYTYLIDGVSAVLTTSNSTFGVQTGPAKFSETGGKITSIRSLTKTGTKVKSFSSSTVTVDDNIGAYPVSADVAVYTNGAGGYTASTLSDALAAFQSKKMVTFYYDKAPKEGGCIRVIVY